MRRDVVADLRQDGHSLRAIAGAVGVSKSQVAKDLSNCPLVDSSVPDRITGLDGKSHVRGRTGEHWRMDRKRQMRKFAHLNPSPNPPDRGDVRGESYHCDDCTAGANSGVQIGHLTRDSHWPRRQVLSRPPSDRTTANPQPPALSGRYGHERGRAGDYPTRPVLTPLWAAWERFPGPPQLKSLRWER